MIHLVEGRPLRVSNQERTRSELRPLYRTVHRPPRPVDDRRHGSARIRLRTSPAAGPLEEIAASVADLVLADYQTGMACLSHIGAHPGRRQPSVIIVSALIRELDIRAALRAGVSGYLRQACRPGEVLHAVLSVARGVRYLCPTITNGLADSVTLATLTERESKVLELVAARLCNITIRGT